MVKNGIIYYIFVSVIRGFLKIGVAAQYPEPKDKEKFVRDNLYNYNYDSESVLNTKFSWPRGFHF